ncbi:hypothetical protein [Phyllobacterium phragmitis]|uniref:hypothetical protein n=1 Tax=Phyllobacterium phragmitis TaxID=2670329 RepID=UPI0018EE2EC4|nr:hypothetical protein [Phyllobacterium phragmitis]
MREGLDALGLDSDTILHHATPRLFYACELGVGAREALLGLSNEGIRGKPVAAIADAWRRRWLNERSRRIETLEKLQALEPHSVQASLHPVEILGLLESGDGQNFRDDGSGR